jgi:hypothetical protein
MTGIFPELNFFIFLSFGVANVGNMQMTNRGPDKGHKGAIIFLFLSSEKLTELCAFYSSAFLCSV